MGFRVRVPGLASGVEALLMARVRVPVLGFKVWGPVLELRVPGF